MLYKQAQRDVHQFKICCCDFDFDLIKIGWIFTDIWRYNDFQNGGRRYLGIVLPPYETTHVVSVAGRSCLSNYFHVNLIRISIWIFRIFGLKCLLRPQDGSFWGRWTPKCDYSSSRPPKGTFLRKSASFKLSSAVKIHWGVWPVGELTESVTDTQTQTHTQVNLYSVDALHSIGQTTKDIDLWVKLWQYCWYCSHSAGSAWLCDWRPVERLDHCTSVMSVDGQ